MNRNESRELLDFSGLHLSKAGDPRRTVCFIFYFTNGVPPKGVCQIRSDYMRPNELDDLFIDTLDAMIKAINDAEVRMPETACEMGIEHPFMRNNPMTRVTRQYFDEFRQEVLNRVAKTPLKAEERPAKPKKTNSLPVNDQFTSSPNSAILNVPDERDVTIAGEGLEGVLRQQPSREQQRRSGHHPRPVRTRIRSTIARSKQPRRSDSSMRLAMLRSASQSACGGRVVNKPSIDMRPATGRHARPEATQTSPWILR